MSDTSSGSEVMVAAAGAPAAEVHVGAGAVAGTGVGHALCGAWRRPGGRVGRRRFAGAWSGEEGDCAAARPRREDRAEVVGAGLAGAAPPAAGACSGPLGDVLAGASPGGRVQQRGAES